MDKIDLKKKILDTALEHLASIAFLAQIKEADSHSIRGVVKAGLRAILDTPTGDLKDIKDAYPHLAKVEVSRLYRLAEDELVVLNGGRQDPTEDGAQELLAEDLGGPLTAALDAVDERLREFAEVINAQASELEDHREIIQAMATAMNDAGIPHPDDDDEPTVDSDAGHIGNYI